MYNPHTPSPASGRSFDDYGIFHFGAYIKRRFYIGNHSFGSGNNRYACLLHGLFSKGFIAESPDYIMIGSDENDFAGFADFGKIRVFRQETVTGMDSLGIGYFSGGYYPSGIEIALARRRRAYAYGFIRESHVQRIGVGLRVYGHRGDTQLLAGTYYPQSDLAAIGNQDFFEQSPSVQKDKQLIYHIFEYNQPDFGEPGIEKNAGFSQ